MSDQPSITTARLLLRHWTDNDQDAFAALNADPRVMAHFPKVLDRAESDTTATRIRDHFARHGFGLWAVEVPGVAPFVGFVGLSIPQFHAHFTPCVEIGWRLAYQYWGHGYASEGARAALALGFNELKLVEIVSMTAVDNQRSRDVMHRIGMTYSPVDDFDHPQLPAGDRLLRHVLYRLSRTTWERRAAVEPVGNG
ncbi:MAG TPA: GNAT family N-acetyltransferase [Pirellulales bacterium]